MPNEVVNGGASGDTTHIDDVIGYLESPEYLRMIARQQGESPDSLLSGSTTEPWRNAGTASTPATLTPLTLHDGATARITEDAPWGATPLSTGDIVTVISDQSTTSEGVPWHRVRDDELLTWNVPASALSPITDGLADWERELLEIPQQLVTLPEPDPVPVSTGATAATFGVQWGNASNRCECTTCARSRVTVPTRPVLNTRPVQRRSAPLQLRVRDGWWKFRDALHDRREFNTYGSLRGRSRPESDSSGQLSDKSTAAAQLWRADQSKIDYVVYSYRTPIAWHVTGTNYSEWIYPDVRYSATTSAQQNKIRTALEANQNQYMIDSVRDIREA